MNFSYDQYRSMIKNILATGKYKDYSDAKDDEPFIVLRHDVEFTPERALAIAKIEHRMGLHSSYFFQIRNHSYNTLSKTNRERILEIYHMGHPVGLHVHSEGINDMAELESMIKLDVQTMRDYLGIPIDRFSFHRPSKVMLEANMQIDGLINTYDRRFFHFKEHINSVDELDIRYMADSMHRWNYGYPDKTILNTMDKIQILIHPYSWTEEGYENRDNFSYLLDEKREGLKDVFDQETKHFKEVKDAL